MRLKIIVITYQDARTDSCRPLWLVVLRSLSRHVTFESLTSTHVTSDTSPSHHLTSSRNILSPSPPTQVNSESLRTAPDTRPDRPRMTTTHGAPSPGHLAGAPRRGTPAANHRAGSAGPARARPRPRHHAVALAGRAATWPGRWPSLRRTAAVGGKNFHEMTFRWPRYKHKTRTCKPTDEIYRTNSLEWNSMVAGGRRFQDEAARYENTRRESDRRRAGSSNSHAAVARVTRCDTLARWRNIGRTARGACSSLSARKTPMQSRWATRSRTLGQPSDSRAGVMWSRMRVPVTILDLKLSIFWTRDKWHAAAPPQTERH